MTPIKTKLPGLFVLETDLKTDSRGGFEKLFCNLKLKKFLGNRNILQINRSINKLRGTVRGLHFQNSPFMEMKLVKCIKGSVWDISVDLRLKSPTYLKWHANIISEQNNQMMLIPEGFAHGFQTLENDCELIYFHTESYNSSLQSGVNIYDKIIDVNWPLDVSVISERDKQLQFIDKNFNGIDFELSSL